MDRRSLIKNAGIAGVLAAGAAPAVHAQPAVRWRLASSFPKSLDTIFGGAETFARAVKAMSGGRFDVSVHPAGELMPAFGVVDGVQNGTVECAHTAPYYFFGKDETFAIGCAIPFGLNSRQMTAWMFEGNGLKLMREFYAKYGIINFPAGNTGSQMGGWYRKEIKSAQDTKGLKFRVGGFAGKVIERLGGVPQNIPGGEIYQALEKGTIDAAEWVGPYDDQKLGFNKVAPFYYYPGWWEGGAALSLFVNQKAIDALPELYRHAIEAAAGETVAWSVAKYDAQNPRALRELVAGGTRLAPFPASVLEATFNAAQELYTETAAANPRFKKVHDHYMAFRKEQVLWSRVAEGTFDNFMARLSANNRI
jgi:TRAP-type mannitol/chloroaromatic compound transport system substrate-binding protein